MPTLDTVFAPGQAPSHEGDSFPSVCKRERSRVGDAGFDGLLNMKRLRHRVGGCGISLLMLPILAWVWLVAREPVVSVFNGSLPRHVVSGALFSEQFDIIHAGFVLDQPTIGKWLFWFSFMAVSSLPYAAAVSWLGERRNAGGYFAFGVASSVLAVFLLCILSWPTVWLVQYVCSMGFTPRRIGGLLYAVAGGLLVSGFLYRAVRRPKDDEAELQERTPPIDENAEGN
jgi:hypothetical protein